MKHRAPFARRRQPGFALLITIVLVAFLVLLLVGLATFTRVETRVADNSQSQAKARQNALMALNIAVGRLQAAAGPDTRVTTTADLVPARHIEKKYWTGVWQADAAGDPEHLAWLVSGAAPAGSATVGTALTAAAGNSLVELVGASTTDIAATATTGNQVRVETQPVTADSVPGMSGPQTIGNFAYWVGDEGVKAKVTLADPWENPAPATLAAANPDTTAEQAGFYRFIHAQRTGTEGLGYTAADARLGTAADPVASPGFKNALPKVVSLPQFSMAGTNAAAQTALGGAARLRFHDVTTDSISVLADVARGGLKKDLTAWLAADPAAAATEPKDDDYIAPGNGTDQFGLPKWGLLRSYANTRDSGAALAPVSQTDTRHGIAPIITYARMAFNVTAPATGGLYKFHVMPAVTLWNPYNVPILADPDGSFEFCVKYYAPNTPNNTYRLETNTSSNLDNPTRDHFDVNNISVYTGSNTAANSIYYGTGPDNQFWRFKVKLTRNLGAGESRLFTVDDDDDGDVYSPGQSRLSDAVVDAANSVTIPSRTGLTATQMAATSFIWLNTENGASNNIAQMELLLAPLVPADRTTAASIEAYLRANAHQQILGHAAFWVPNSNRLTLSETNTGEVLAYQRFELNMSTLAPSEGNGNGSAGTPRWLANLNPHSLLSLRPPMGGSNRNTSYVRHSAIRGESGFAPGFPNADDGYVSAGTRVAVDAVSGDAQNLVLREFQPAGVPLFSLAQLQHANVSSINLNPAYAIGNSLANMNVSRINTSEPLGDDGYTSFPNASFNRLYDLSYLLNEALWDRYFFSTVPSGLTAAEVQNSDYRLPNARHRFNWSAAAPAADDDDDLEELKLTSTAAKRLLLDGGFNVNSTSIQAWRALLHSRNGIEADPDDSDNKHVYSRFTDPVDAADPNARWLGYRILSDDQIDALATAIVAEVRARGPFLSLADFVNRRLAADATGLKGPLQAAIDATSGANAINTADSTMEITRYTEYVANVAPSEEAKAIYKGSTDTALPGNQPHTSRAAFAPGFLTQADLLSAIGPNLTARSDTFRIRAYGDVVNPATGDTLPQARAWCEAIVQRLPDYVDPSMPAETDLAAAPASAAKTTNQAFGRRFKIVSFRWLSPDDI